MKDENKDIVWRIKLIYLGVLIFSLIIIYKVINIQFVEGDQWRKRAENLTLRYESVEAIRGNIISSDSNLLATSIPIFDVKLDLDKTVIPSDTFKFYLNALSDSLSRIFPEKSKEEFKNLLLIGRQKEERDFLLRRDIDYTQLKRMRSFPILKRGKYKGGFIVEEKDYRKMPFKELGSRTIGYKNIKENLYVGLEGAYSKELEGVSGKRLIRKIANGIWRPVEHDNQIEPENGKDIVTTIDINIQDVAEHALRKCLDSNEADHGCAVLMEVETGYIKAIANLKRHKDGTYGEDINYAIWESAEPGSTFKLASLISVLEDGKFDTNELVNTGKCTYADRTMEDSHEQGYGRISLARAFEVSSNVGISEIVYRTFKDKPQKYIDFLYEMSLNKPLGLDIKGEGLPFIKNTKNPTWSRTSLPWMAIGYELQLTPLQTLTLYNAIANKGKMVKPLFVKEILQTGKLIERKEAIIINKSICSEKTLNKVQSILEGVVEHGTAKHLMNTVYKIAGKTGTAKIDYGNNKDSKVYRASFVGYFPADKPKYSCIVIVNNPTKGQYYGGAIAAPVFKEIADKVYATQLDIHQTNKNMNAKIAIPYVTAGNQQELFTIYTALNLPFLTNNANALYIASQRSDSLQKYIQKNFNPKLVPDVNGMGVKEAVYLLEKSGLKVTISGKGKVIGQSIPAETPILKGSIIYLTLSNPAVDFKNKTVAKSILPTITVNKDSIANEVLLSEEKNIKTLKAKQESIDKNKVVAVSKPKPKDNEKIKEKEKLTENTKEKTKIKVKENSKEKLTEKPKEKAKTKEKENPKEKVKAKQKGKEKPKEKVKEKIQNKAKTKEASKKTQKTEVKTKKINLPKKAVKKTEKIKKSDKKTNNKSDKKSTKKSTNNN
ncbi:MAG: penicillin-binding transpeptidase domain-containing protein [Bacteroidota bacterium]